MKFSELWLREWVNPPVDTHQLVEQLTMAGLEVDSAEPVAGPFKGVVVGLVLEVKPHPDADRLRVCTVDAGQEKPLNIVCGASNVTAGQKVPVALIGAEITADFKIKRSRLRGVESEGMICSAEELGLAESSNGILVLPADASIGQDFRDYFKLNDTAIAIELTPNRGDCTSIRGIAREVAVANSLPFAIPVVKQISNSTTKEFPVKVLAVEACPLYTARVIEQVNTKAETPLWLKEKLRRSGLRSINPVVDVLNFVMLEHGQPLHAFDLHKLNGELNVRLAKPGETAELLDGQKIQLQAATLVIADKNAVAAVAGIMGCANSAVSGSTESVLLESAFFTPKALAGQARCYGLNTDASYRFERGVEPGLQRYALDRATELLIEIAGGQPGPIVECKYEQHLPQSKEVYLPKTLTKRLLGIEIPNEWIVKTLRQLDMVIEQQNEGWQVTIPMHRFDISIGEDLVEEIARLYGYDNIPLQPVHTQLQPLPGSETAVDLRRINAALVDRGYQEAITYSFIAPEMHKLLNPQEIAIKLTNPISSEMSVMRCSLWAGLIQTALYNLNRQQQRLRLFESGLCFKLVNNELEQEPRIAGLATGLCEPEQWGIKASTVDFFDIKADVENIFNLYKKSNDVTFIPMQHAALHPGQSAAIKCEGRVIGYVGALHPKIQKELGIKLPIYLFELELAKIGVAKLPMLAAIPKFPAVRRDIAILVDQEINVSVILEQIKQTASKLAYQIRLFDVYQGTGIPDGKKSLAVAILFQHPSQTLQDEEVDAIVKKVIADLNCAFGVILREN